jgi:hypothetical protein
MVQTINGIITFKNCLVSGIIGCRDNAGLLGIKKRGSSHKVKNAGVKFELIQCLVGDRIRKLNTIQLIHEEGNIRRNYLTGQIIQTWEFNNIT